MTEPQSAVSAKICGFLRKSAVSAVSCALQMLELPGEGCESAKICGFLRKSAFWVLSVTLVLSPETQSKKRKPTNIKQPLEVVPGMRGSQICSGVALFMGERGTHEQIPRESQEDAGTIPGKSL